MSGHVSTLDLHRLRYGELSPAKAAALRAHLQTCELCARRHRTQLAEREVFALASVPPAIAALSTPPARGRRWWRYGGLAAALTAAVVAWSLTAPEPTDDASMSTRAKGDSIDLEIWVSTESGPRPLRPGESLRSGDTVQLLYDPGDATAVWLAGRDSDGTVEVYGRVLPRGSGLQPAPFALTLDHSSGAQEFALFVPDQQVTAADVKLGMAGDADLPGRWSRIDVPKE